MALYAHAVRCTFVYTKCSSVKVSVNKINITNNTHLFYFCPALTYSYSRWFVLVGGGREQDFSNAEGPRLEILMFKSLYGNCAVGGAME